MFQKGPLTRWIKHGPIFHLRRESHSRAGVTQVTAQQPTGAVSRGPRGTRARGGDGADSPTGPDRGTLREKTRRSTHYEFMLYATVSGAQEQDSTTV
jgi:hypothetical protein